MAWAAAGGGQARPSPLTSPTGNRSARCRSGVPVVGPAAALGLSAFFVGAVVTRRRAGNHDLRFPLVLLALAVGSLVLSLAV